LLPGDPLRARYIAERFLERAELVNSVRNMYAYTGYYRDQRLSVMGTGMGIPSCSIYATELVEHYGVRRLLRIGTCGAVHADVQLGDLVLGQGACTDSAVNRSRFRGQDYAAIASWPLLQQIWGAAGAAGIPLRVGNVYSTDLFYGGDPQMLDTLERMGVLGIEMEAAGLYGLASERGVEAAALLTVSDHLRQGTHMTPEQRQLGLDRMILLALDACSRR
jgi:purine-nucleoside phosphorylase